MAAPHRHNLARPTAATGAAPYLSPYADATRRHGAGFQSLLWASPRTQAKRFDALLRTYDFEGKSILDAGCGRADFLDFLLERNIHPSHYVGLEAIPALADIAAAKRHGCCQIVRGDFVADPAKLFVGADVVVFCGSLNTLEPAAFDATLRRAFDATADQVAFNFLSSPDLAGQPYLYWHRAPRVRALVAALSRDVRELSDYLRGDYTMAATRKDAA